MTEKKTKSTKAPATVTETPAPIAKPAEVPAPVAEAKPAEATVKSATLKSAAARMFTKSIATAKATAKTAKSHRVEDAAMLAAKPLHGGGTNIPRRGAAKGR